MRYIKYGEKENEVIRRTALFGTFVKDINNIGEQTTLGCEHIVGHVGSKLLVRFGEIARNFIGKIQNFSFHLIGL